MDPRHDARGAASSGRRVVSGAPPPRAEGIARGGMGHLRDGPRSQVLQAHGGGPEAVASRSASMDAVHARGIGGAQRGAGLNNPRMMKRAFHLSAGRRGITRDVDRELAFHIEMRTRELVALGKSPADARREAIAVFGDMSAVRTECL